MVCICIYVYTYGDGRRALMHIICIHIMDLAEVHISCLEKLTEVNDDNYFKVYNVGSGKGTSVLELISLFENVNQLKLNYKIGKRRNGDVIVAYADSTKIKDELNWSTKYSLENALETAWKWELNLKTNEQRNQN